MPEYVLSKKLIGDISDEGWAYLNNLDFDALIKIFSDFDEYGFEKKRRILNVFSLIPVNNYGTMISLSKDPSKLIQFMVDRT